MIEVTILSVLQGVAEFLPISSSGHLVLGKALLGLNDAGMRLDIFLHVGTLLSIFIFYFAIIRRIVVNLEWGYLMRVVASAIPVGIVGVLFKDQLEAAFSSTRAVGAALIFTGLMLIVTRFIPKGEKEVSFGRAILMGMAQAIAILPGVSRSGMTLVAARSAKVDGEKAAEFSFLMSAPPIMGAALLEALKAAKSTECTTETSWALTIYGCVLAAVVGYLALKLLVKSLKGRWFWMFGPYCLIVGMLTLCCGCGKECDCCQQPKAEVVEAGGLSFDFQALSDEMFKDNPNAVNLISAKDMHKEGVTLTGDGTDRKDSQLKIPVKFQAHEKDIRVRVSFGYRSFPVSGKPGRSIVFFRGKVNDMGYYYATIGETDEFWRFFSKEFVVPAGIETMELNPKVERFGTFEIRDIKVCLVEVDPNGPEIEMMNTPHGWLGGDFAVSSNGIDIVNFQWRQIKGKFDKKRKNEFVATVPKGFELVAPLNPKKGKFSRRNLPDGSVEVRYGTTQVPWVDKFDWWRRHGVMVTSHSAVGTRGKMTFRFEADGKLMSNIAEVELFVIPEIQQAKAAKRFFPGVALAGSVGFLSGDDAVDAQYAKMMVRWGVRMMKAFGSSNVSPPDFWHKAGIPYIIPEGPIANAYSVIADPQPPADEKFIALHPTRGHWLSHSICPTAIYQEKPFFKTNIVERIRWSHKGANGSYANWEPFFYREEGCMCKSCMKEFAKWKKLPEEEVAKDWPECVARKGRLGGDIMKFRSWQCAQVALTLDRYVREITGGEDSMGLVPAVHFEQATRRWIGHTDTFEYDMLDYGKKLKWICPWGPYSGFWDASAPFGGIGMKWMHDYFNAKDTIVDARRDYPGVKMMAYPHGLQMTSWLIEPEILGMNLSAYFFFGWDAALVYFFPMGYDARYWKAFADAAELAGRYEGFVFDGKRIDDKVCVSVGPDFPKPDGKAFHHLFPSYRNVSYLQSVAYELNGRRIVALFNYHPTAMAEVELKVGNGDVRKVKVPAARVKVFEF